MSLAAQPRVHRLPMETLSRAKLLLLEMLLVGVALFAYFPSLHGEFIWDDNLMITRNPLITGSEGLQKIWFSNFQADYLPVTYSAFWVLWRLCGENPFGYHLLTLALHALGCLLLWRLLLKLRVPGAWFVAAIFAVHPLNVESVSWIAELKNTASFTLCLVAIFSYLRNEESRSVPAYIASIILFALALLCKGAVVVLPVAMLLYAWWHHGRVTVKDAVRSVPFFVLAVGLGLVNIWFQSQRTIGHEVVNENGFAARLAIAGKALWFYFYKTVVPLDLTFIYPRWENATFVAYLPVIAALAVVGGLWRWRKSATRSYFAATICYLLFLMPALGFINMYWHKYSFVADHFCYFSLPVAIAIVVAVAVKLLKPHLGLLPLQALGLIMVGILTTMTWQRASLYNSHISLYEDILRHNPTCNVALANYGAELVLQGKPEEAVRLFERAPTSSDAQYYWGNVELEKKELAQAEQHYREALRINPRFAAAHRQLGLSLHQQGKAVEALQQYSACLKFDPADIVANNNSSELLLATSHVDEALTNSITAIKLNTKCAQSYYNAGTAFLLKGRQAEALQYYEKALQLKPDYAEAHNNLGFLLLKAGQFQEAEKHFTASLKLKPNQVDAHYNRGNALSKLRKFGAAEDEFKTVLQMDPGYVEALYQWGVVCEQEREYSEAIEKWRAAVRLKPAWPEALRSLSWLLSTVSDEKLRDGREALRLARALSTFTGEDNGGTLEALAAAYAATRQFDEAIAHQKRAIEMYRSQHEAKQERSAEQRLQLFQNNTAYCQL